MFGRRPRPPSILRCSTCSTPQIEAWFRAYTLNPVALGFVRAPTCPRSGCPGNIAEQHNLAIEKMLDQERMEKERRLEQEYEWVRQKALKLTGLDKKLLEDCGVEKW